jgi:DNA-binding transcriptional LysR family regulator
LTHKAGAGGNWDDLRFVLAVAETGSVSAAARQLGVNHATVLRRIAAFEAAEGAPTFDRTAQDYSVPPDRLRVIEAAREAAAAFAAVGRTIRGAGSALVGTIRVTSTDSLCASILPLVLAELQAQARGLMVELISNNHHVDLARMDADITVRPAPRLPDDLRGEVAGAMAFAAYAPAGQATEEWLLPTGMLVRSPISAWMAANVAPDRIRPGADSFVILREMVAAGLGRAVLPAVLAAGDPRLLRLPDLPPTSVPIWVASHVDLAEAPRLRQARARLVLGLRARAALLAA